MLPRLVPTFGLGNRFDYTNGCSHGHGGRLDPPEGVLVVQLAARGLTSGAHGVKLGEQLARAPTARVGLDFVEKFDGCGIVHGD